MAIDRVVDVRTQMAREAAAARWEAKKRASLANRNAARQKRRTARVITQAVEKLISPVPRSSKPVLTSDDGRIRLLSNGNAKPAFSKTSVAATEYDKDILTRTVFGEAENDDEPGRRAVAWALINRARDPKRRFPTAIAEVCTQKGEFRTWANPKLVKTANKLERHSPSYRKIRAIVDDALAGRSVDPTRGGAFYYYNGRVPPNWATAQNCSSRSKVHTFCHSKFVR